MKSEARVIILAVVAGLFVVVLDAALDALVFYRGLSFIRAIVFAPPSEIFIRTLILGVFVVFGVLISGELAKRKRAEMELMAANREKETILDSQLELVSYHDLEQRIIWANRAACESVGTTREGIIGRYCYEVWMGRGEVCENCAVALAMKTGIPREMERETPDGRTWFMRGYPVRDEKGGIIGGMEIRQDITERVRAEEALGDSERWFSTTLNSIGDAVIATDEQGSVIFMNPFARQLTGRSEKEAVGLPIREVFKIFNEMTGEAAENPVEKVLKDGIVVGLANHTVLEAKDGSRLPIDDSGAPIKDRGGRVIGAVLVFRDVTERRRSERALRESEERYRTLFENAPMGIGLATMDGQILATNDSMCRITGYSREEFVGINVTSVYTNPGDRAALLERLRERGYVEGFETELKHKDGTEYHVRLTIVPLELGGREILLTVAEDITEQRQAEEESRFHAYLLNSVEQAVIAIDTDRTITYWNAAAEKLYGWSADEAIGRKIWDAVVVSKDTEDEILARWTEGGKLSGEFTFQRRDGTSFRAMAVASNVFDGEGNPRGVVGVTSDITRMKELEANLLQAQKIEAIGRLAGGVAHDFNNLLTAITGYSDLLLRNIGDDALLRDDVNQIRKAADRAKSLTRQLLAFARKQVLSPQVLNVNSVVSGVGNMLRRLIGEDIELVISLDPHPGYVMADPGQLEQVIINLAINARDAMPSGGRLTIKTSRVMLDAPEGDGADGVRFGEFVCLSVEDTGRGIDRRTSRHLFEPFFSTKNTGTGLGLAVVHGIVKQHGGWVKVLSEPGSGSAFRVYLPVSPPEPESVGELSEEELSEGQGRGERILLVEDEGEVRDFAARVLRENGYEVFEAASSEDAMEVFERVGGGFDMVFSDVVLPGESGLQLVDRLLSIKPELLVLLSTGYTDKKSRWSLIHERHFPFLQKPYTLAELLDAIRTAMETN